MLGALPINYSLIKIYLWDLPSKMEKHSIKASNIVTKANRYPSDHNLMRLAYALLEEGIYDEVSAARVWAYAGRSCLVVWMSEIKHVGRLLSLIKYLQITKSGWIGKKQRNCVWNAVNLERISQHVRPSQSPSKMGTHRMVALTLTHWYRHWHWHKHWQLIALTSDSVAKLNFRIHPSQIDLTFQITLRNCRYIYTKYFEKH